MQAQLSGEGQGLTGASPMVLAHPSIPDPPWRRACPLFDCAVNPVYPPPPSKPHSKCSPQFLHLSFFFSPVLFSNQLICTVPWVCRCALWLHHDWLWWGSSTPSVREKMEEGKQERGEWAKQRNLERESLWCVKWNRGGIWVCTCLHTRMCLHLLVWSMPM